MRQLEEVPQGKGLTQDHKYQKVEIPRDILEAASSYVNQNQYNKKIYNCLTVLSSPFENQTYKYTFQILSFPG